MTIKGRVPANKVTDHVFLITITLPCLFSFGVDAWYLGWQEENDSWDFNRRNLFVPLLRGGGGGARDHNK